MPSANTNWNSEDWLERCAWCVRKIPEDQEVFGISIRLHPDAFREVKKGGIEPLFLFKAGKTVPMMVVTDDSPAKQDGKDAIFQVCSEKCGRELKDALQEELPQ